MKQRTRKKNAVRAFLYAMLPAAGLLVLFIAACGKSTTPQRLAIFKSYQSYAEACSVNRDFYTYDGFRDWYRFPLKYPYSIFAIDSLSRGCLDQCEDPSKIREGSGTILVSNIIQLLPEENFLLFQTLSYDQKQKTYGIFVYDSGKLIQTESIEEFNRLRKEYGVPEGQQMQSPEYFFYRAFP